VEAEAEEVVGVVVMEVEKMVVVVEQEHPKKKTQSRGKIKKMRKNQGMDRMEDLDVVAMEAAREEVEEAMVAARSPKTEMTKKPKIRNKNASSMIDRQIYLEHTQLAHKITN